MPFTSADIASQIAQGQQASMMHVHSADVISESMRRQQNPQFGAPQLAGKVFNIGGAVGVPVAGFAAGALGLDGMGMGMRAYGAARAVGMGAMGAAGVGAMAFGGATAVGMGASYAVNQMSMGAQQQQNFLQGMQQNYNFMTPHGSGFSNRQLGNMGGQLRQMSGQIGPLGQMTSFDELAGLAQNMGQMGMARGTQDVSTFTQNFRKMLDSVKHIAKEMGSSLKEAQQTMAGMRNSGLMHSVDQKAMASEMRHYGLGGNIAMPELTQMAGIGSRIARAVGGRGSQGAFGGVRTLGNIGLAMESGVISEEDVFNTTGMHGAEGRQALAASQMQHSAAWLRSGRGRRFLASMAGTNGKLDPASVQAMMSGDMSIGNTMQRSGANLNAVGREDFIRNEGRLRGSALEAFGGNIPAMALMQWAGSKNIDIQNMDDRSMIFAQRQLGMSRDEVDQAVKMVNGMPEMRRQSRRTAATDDFRSGLAAHRRTSGGEGVKRKFEEAREHLQNKLQGAGQAMYTDLTNEIESEMEKMTGTIVQEASADIDKAYESMKGGGSSLSKLLFGTGTDFKQTAKSGVFSDGFAATGGLQNNVSVVDKFDKGHYMGLGTSLRDRMEKAGYKSFGDTDSSVTAGFERARAMAEGSLMTGDEVSRDRGAANAEEFRRIYKDRGFDKLKGEDRLKAVQKFFSEEGDMWGDNAKDIADRLGNSDGRAAMSALASMEEGAKVSKSARIGANAQLPEGVETAMGLGGVKETELERQRRYGGGSQSTKNRLLENVLGYKESDGLFTNAAKLAGMGVAHLASFGATAVYGAATAVGEGAAAHQQEEKVGGFLLTKEGMQLSRDVLEGKDVSGILGEKIENEKDAGMKSFYSDLSQGSRLLQRAKDGEKVDWNHEDNKGARIAIQSAFNSYTEQTKINRKRQATIEATGARRATTAMKTAGLLDDSGNITTANAFELERMGGGALGTFQARARDLALEAKGSGSSEDFATLQTAGAGMLDRLIGTNVGDLRKQAQYAAAHGDKQFSEQIGDIAQNKARVARYANRGSVGSAMALGLKLDKGEVAKLRRDPSGLSQFIADKLGVGGGVDEAGLKALDENIHKAKSDTSLSIAQREEKVAALEKQRLRGQEDNSLKERINDLGKAGTKEHGEKLERLMLDPDYKKRVQEQASKAEEGDRSVRELTSINKGVESMVRRLDTLPQEIAAAAAKGPTGTATPPKGTTPEKK